MADCGDESGSKITDGSAFMAKVSVGEDVKEEANKLKTIANQYFKDKDYEQAITYYSKAIDLNPGEVTYYGNRSFAHIKLENFGYALNDASTALDLDKTYVKAYYRRASANMALGKFKLALKDFEAVTKRCPNDKDAKAKFTECKKIVTRINFEKAIAVDDCKPVSETIDIDGISIEESYSGPHLDDGRVTPEFMNELMDTFKKQGKLHKKHVYRILVDVKNLFQSQDSLVDITVPPGEKFTICGDIHGQYYDLMNIFSLNGIPSKDNPYLFNGDFVDRGSFSVECILVLFGYKLLYPQHFYMSRGNHESQTMNQMYGFDGEVKAKYNAQMAELFTEVYNWLPLCHLINDKILVMHGGLFKEDGVKIDDLRKIDRNRQPPEAGLMCDLLWSDPQPQPGRSPSKRGVGTQFGPDVTRRFIDENDLSYVVRSHEVKNLGYEMAHGGKCVTVFSAPNYCDTMGNKGAYITIRGDELEPHFTSYEAVPHPNVKPMAYANSFLSMLA